MKDVFEIKNHPYNFQRDVTLQRRNVNTALYGTEKIASLGAHIWNLVPTILKCSKSFNEFKKKIFQNELQRNVFAVYAKCMHKTKGLYKD